MSFDLYLRGNNLTLPDLLNHFDKYPEFQQQKFSDMDSAYALVNPATGVYCYFTTEEPGTVCFGLNYNRPTFFALETLPLVESVCRHFRLLVEDPQEEVTGPASSSDLIKSWRIHNERAVNALKAQGVALNYMPESKANEWWAYTRMQEQMAKDLEDSVFLPAMIILKGSVEEPFRMIVCHGGIPQLLPPADMIYLARSDSTLAGEVAYGFVSFEVFVDLVAPFTSEYRFGTQSYLLLEPIKFPEVVSLIRELELLPAPQYERVERDGFHDVVLSG